MALLEVSRLHKKFGGLHAVNDVSFGVAPGTIKAVIGPNGAGKTTLFNLITGTLPASAGEVRFSDANILGRKPHQIAACGIARTYQNIKLFHGMTALENIMVGRHLRSRAGFMASMLKMPWSRREERAIRDKAMELLELLEIAAKQAAFAGHALDMQARVMAVEHVLHDRETEPGDDENRRQGAAAAQRRDGDHWGKRRDDRRQ